MDATTTAIVHAITAIVGGVGGFAATLRSIRKNVTSLEHKFKKLTEETVLLSDIELWKQSVIQGLRLEWEQLKFDIEKRLFERQSNPIGFEEFKRRIDELEKDLSIMERRVSEQRFVTQTDFNEFVREGAKQWNEMNRTLGMIMGEQTRPRSR